MGYTFEELENKFNNKDEFDNYVSVAPSLAILLKNRLGELKMIGKFIIDSNDHIIYHKGTLNSHHLFKKYQNSIGCNNSVIENLNEDDIVFFEFKKKKNLITYALKIKYIKEYGIVDSPQKSTMECQIFVPLKYWQSI